MAEERRKSPRIAVDVPARLTIGEETITARVKDICRDAVLVEVERSYPLATRMTFETELPRVVGKIRATGTVIRLAGNGEDYSGMAILFDELPADTLMRIELFVSEQEG